MKRKVGEWPHELADLNKVFNSLCTIYTFLSTRKHVTPTVEVLLSTVEKELKRKVELVELAKIQYLLPQDVFFGYIDINQTLKDQDEDVYAVDEGGKQHILVFEFLDGALKPEKKKNGKSKLDMAPPTFSIAEMKSMIEKRRTKFVNAVEELIKDHEDPVDLLNREGPNKLPIRPTFVDPMDSMGGDSNSANERPSITSIITSLKQSEYYRNQIAERGERKFDSKEAEYGQLDHKLPPEVLEALHECKGITQFYSHQADAINAIDRGEHVVVSTATSSGKSLIYQVPVLEHIKEGATAIYIFPTKALAQDQKQSFEKMLAYINPEVHVDTYDGDTPMNLRQDIRDTSQVIFTNPDMIHTSILPNWKQWQPFLRSLRFVVVDEIHGYNGLFGSHVAMVMRRLRRLCRMILGEDSVQFISCSATVRDPVEMMKTLFGVDSVTLVNKDGSPHGERHVVLWRTPQVVDGDTSSGRVNPIKEAADLFELLISNGIKTIAFCRVRKACELLIKTLRQRLSDEMGSQVMSYRGGYSAADRRKIESEMFHGGLMGIVATNALELGIDIGSLDAVLVVGFPFTISNFRQQIGRAGRRNKDSLAVLIGGGGAVDEYYMDNPDQVFDQPDVKIAIETGNPLVVESHLQCAGFEKPIDVEQDGEFFGEDNLNSLINRLYKEQDGTFTTHTRFMPWPAEHVSLRGIQDDSIAVVDTTNNRNVIIEEIEASRSTFTLYEGGIFLHQGHPYLISEFDPKNKLAKIQRVDVDWITRQRDYTDIDPLSTTQINSLPSGHYVNYGPIRHTSVVFGFFKLDKREQIMDAVEVDNPPYVFDSKGFWINIPSRTIKVLKEHNLSPAGGIHGAEHALLNLMPKYVALLPYEVGTECKAKEKEFASRATKRLRPARLIFYDRDGSGITSKAFEFVGELLDTAVERIDQCDCKLGCPGCVCSESCKEDSVVISKAAARVILGDLAGKPMQHVPQGPEENLKNCKIDTIYAL